MSDIVVHFPDCGDVDSTESPQGELTVTTKDCAPPGPPPLISWWETLAGLILVVAMIVAIAIVRYRAHELKPKRMEEKRRARQQEIDGQVKVAAAHKQCMMCGTKYEPEFP